MHARIHAQAVHRSAQLDSTGIDGSFDPQRFQRMVQGPGLGPGTSERSGEHYGARSTSRKHLNVARL